MLIINSIYLQNHTHLLHLLIISLKELQYFIIIFVVFINFQIIFIKVIIIIFVIIIFMVNFLKRMVMSFIMAKILLF